MTLQEELLSYVRFDRRVKMAGKERTRATTVGVVPTRMLIEAANRLDLLESENEALRGQVQAPKGDEA